MNRRGFLGALAATLALDPERALWIPGQKLISIPKPKPFLALGDIIEIDGMGRFRVIEEGADDRGPILRALRWIGANPRSREFPAPLFGVDLRAELPGLPRPSLPGPSVY